MTTILMDMIDTETDREWKCKNLLWKFGTRNPIFLSLQWWWKLNFFLLAQNRGLQDYGGKRKKLLLYGNQENVNFLDFGKLPPPPSPYPASGQVDNPILLSFGLNVIPTSGKIVCCARNILYATKARSNSKKTYKDFIAYASKKTNENFQNILQAKGWNEFYSLRLTLNWILFQQNPYRYSLNSRYEMRKIKK